MFFGERDVASMTKDVPGAGKLSGITSGDEEALDAASRNDEEELSARGASLLRFRDQRLRVDTNHSEGSAPELRCMNRDRFSPDGLRPQRARSAAGRE